jgi:hypothetical protein
MEQVPEVEFAPIEYATLLGLVGLAVSVMQSDEEKGRDYIKLLSNPAIEKVAQSVVEKIMSADVQDGVTRSIKLDA